MFFTAGMNEHVVNIYGDEPNAGLTYFPVICDPSGGAESQTKTQQCSTAVNLRQQTK